MKKNVLKMLSILCALVLVAGMTVGCGSKQSIESDQSAKATSKTQDTDKKVKDNEGTGKKFENNILEIMAFEGGFGATYWEPIIEEFKKVYPEVEVELTTNPKIWDMIKPRVLSGSPPDIIYSNYATGGPSALSAAYAAEGVFLDLGEFLEEKGFEGKEQLRDKFLPGILESIQVENKQVYLPTLFSMNGIYYNKTYFDEMGWIAPETWDEFFAFAPLAKEEGKSLFTYQGMYPGYLNPILYSSIANALGVGHVKKITNYEEGALQQEVVKSVLEQFEKIANGNLLDGTIAMNHTQAQTEFINGKTLFCPNGSWFETEMKDVIPEEGFTFGYIPSLALEKGNDRYARVSCTGVFVPKKAKNIELAKEFIKFMYTDKSVEEIAKGTGSVVPLLGAVEIAAPYMTENQQNQYMVLDEGIISYNFSFKGSPKIDVNYNKLKNELYTGIMSQKKSADDFINELEEVATAYRKAFAEDKK